MMVGDIFEQLFETATWTQRALYAAGVKVDTEIIYRCKTVGQFTALYHAIATSNMLRGTQLNTADPIPEIVDACTIRIEVRGVRFTVICEEWIASRVHGRKIGVTEYLPTLKWENPGEKHE